MNKRILHLTLTKKWFDQIASGEKIVEYREIKPHWTQRLLNEHDEVKHYDEVHFRNGYSKIAPFMRVEWMGMRIEDQYEILLGKVLEIKNYAK